jgi:hypothetical protein
MGVVERGVEDGVGRVGHGVCDGGVLNTGCLELGVFRKSNERREVGVSTGRVSY